MANSLLAPESRSSSARPGLPRASCRGKLQIGCGASSSGMAAVTRRSLDRRREAPSRTFTQRERMVASSRPGACDTSMISDRDGGSSIILSRALADASFRSSAVSTMHTPPAPLARRVRKKPGHLPRHVDRRFSPDPARLGDRRHARCSEDRNARRLRCGLPAG